ncbi:MAG: GNAT family N-acetyltransferase [Acholeplasmataceae bacterium]|nr:MAG: GNAT family N-acetyltransferase [Acholeplasmataceae bacterium]
MLIRPATPEDLNTLWEIEKASFDKVRRMSFESLKHSLKTKNQDVFLVESDGLPVAYAILFRYQNTHRLYSIAVLEHYRSQGIGKTLMNHMLGVSKTQGFSRITLEADATNHDLLRFYESFGFKVVKELKDYYGPALPAYRMSFDFEVDMPAKRRAMVNWVVTDLDLPWLKTIDDIHLIDAETYINDERFQRMRSVRIFNLCASYDYQSLGYYVSLLASARLQRVVPNVATINDFSDRLIIGSIGDEATHLIQTALRNLKSDSIELVSFFGHTPFKKYQKLIRALNQLFESPFLVFTFVKSRTWKIEKVQPIPISEVEADAFVKTSAIQYFKQKRFNVSRFKDYQYDLAILIDPDEVNPPSDKIALTKFKIAADRMGFFTEFITKDDYHRINEFDALFIRATTNVNDYTYQFSRYAYSEGLIVIDDPWSILKCSNKLFLTESMRKSGISIPKTCIVSRKSKLDDLINTLGMPIILKQPDSAFSLGVFKVGTRELLQEKLDYLFSMSELVVAQAYIPSDYDWRIGVLDGVPLFACKYHMAKNHWQIINWQSKNKKDQTGLVDSFRIEDVPAEIIDHAIRASKAMGDGFYGVDLKVFGKDVYVIEVNDNPNVDYRIEDHILGDDLYRNIIRAIYRRIEDSRNNKRKVA